MNAEPIAFNSAGVRLVGTRHLPPGKGPHPAVVVLHAASLGGQGAPFYRHLAAVLPRAGVAVLLYDRRGSGESGGDFETADFEALAGAGRTRSRCPDSRRANAHASVRRQPQANV